MTEPVNYAACLTYGHPGKAWYMDGVEYAGITWLDETPKPTKSELDQAWPAVRHQLEVDAIRAERQRRYQAETDVLMAKALRGEEDGVTLSDWTAAVNAIRAELPYPPAP